MRIFSVEKTCFFVIFAFQTSVRRFFVRMGFIAFFVLFYGISFISTDFP